MDDVNAVLTSGQVSDEARHGNKQSDQTSKGSLVDGAVTVNIKVLVDYFRFNEQEGVQGDEQDQVKQEEAHLAVEAADNTSEQHAKNASTVSFYVWYNEQTFSVGMC